MNSGIYLLKFQTGDTYIGQAKDFDSRWARHYREMLQGKHTKLVQDAYNRSGYQLPTKHKVLLCHPDWLDYYEALLILQEAPPLNTQSPRPMSESTKRALVALHERGGAVVGMIETLQQYQETLEKLDAAGEEVERLGRIARGEEVRALEQAAESGWRRQVAELEEAVDDYEDVVNRQGKELEKLRAFRAAVERTGLIGRLLKAWG